MARMRLDPAFLLRRVMGSLAQVILESSNRYSAFVNRMFWGAYSRKWRADVVALEVDTGGETREEYVRSKIRMLGDEWGAPADLERVLDEYVFPYLTPDARVAEIGVGGGRVAAHVAPRVARLYAFDVSKRMLAHARESLAAYGNVSYGLLRRAQLPSELADSLDFVYSFDVLVHVDLHTTWQYIREMHRVLRPGGKAFVHTATLTAPGGWERFAAQDAFSMRGHYFLTPETVRTLAERAGLRVAKESSPDPGNFYLNRDYLAVLERTG